MASQSKHIWNLPNALSILRAFLAIPAVIAIIRHDGISVLAIGIVAAATDFLDGYLARAWHQVSDAGKILDPLADKIIIGGTAIAMLVIGALPVWFVAAALVRDVIIFAGGMYVKSRTNVLMTSNMFGKFTVAVIGLAIVAAMLPFGDSFQWMQPALEYIATAMMCGSLALYAMGMRRVMQHS